MRAFILEDLEMLELRSCESVRYPRIVHPGWSATKLATGLLQAQRLSKNKFTRKAPCTGHGAGGRAQRLLYSSDTWTMPPSFLKEKRGILYVLAAALDHPGLFLGGGVGQGGAVEHDLPCVARAVV